MIASRLLIYVAAGIVGAVLKVGTQWILGTEIVHKSLAHGVVSVGVSALVTVALWETLRWVFRARGE